MGAIYYKGQKYGAMPASAANLPYDAGSQDSTKDKIDEINTAIATTTPTINLTKTSGAWTDRNKKTKKFGNIVLLNFEAVGNGSAVASGADGYLGEIDVLPIADTYSITYCGAYIFSIRLATDGKIYIRNTNASAFTLPTGDWLNITLMFMTAS